MSIARKAKTINKYLGDDYLVVASVGHIRDLPQQNGSVDPDNDFAMTWQVSGEKKSRSARSIQRLKSIKLILATDPDREGEAISWHIQEVMMQKKAIGSTPVERVVFNEITKNAILDAMQNPREINTELVDAYLAGGRLIILWALVSRLCSGGNCPARVPRGAFNLLP